MTNKINQAITRPAAASGETISTYIGYTVTVGTGAYIGPLSITSTGTIIGGVGLILANSSRVATVTNSGTIYGDGGFYGLFEYGKSGYNAVDLDSAFIFINKGTIAGGEGGPGHLYSYGGYVAGGYGGTGVSISAFGTLTNAGVINGGNGGIGYGAPGGMPGVGVAFSTIAVLINSGTITGGAGAFVSDPTASPEAGAYGVNALGGDTIKNNGTIIGGVGTNAYTYHESYSNAQQGARGGIGLHMVGGSLTNGGTIAGGAGGLGFEESSGRGGTGVYLLESVTGTNTGIIRGGNGAYGLQYGSDGGTGLSAENKTTIANSGTIDGGNGGAAAEMTGGAGGTGLQVEGESTASNSGVINGGLGGIANGYYAFGGRGGIGVAIYGEQFTNTGKINGGNAGSTPGFEGSAAKINTAGGDGLVAGSYAVIANAGIITGGTGGDVLLNGGTAGTGGVGVSLFGGTTTNTGTIAGGTGGSVPQGNYNNAIGGQGGAGAYVGEGATLTNDKLIRGGAGGYNIYTGNTGGAGVIIAGGVFTNAGMVAGGAGGSSQVAGAMGDAVSFAAAGTLVAAPGAKFTGNVVSTLTSGAELELTGTSTTALAGIGTQFIGINLISFATGAARVLEGSLGYAPGATTPSPEIAGFAAHDKLVLDDWSCAPAKTTFNITPKYTQVEFQNSVKQITIVNMPDLIATDLEVTQGNGKTTLTGLGTAATTLGSGAAEFVRLGGTGTGTIGKGATEQIQSGGTVTATTIAGGDLILETSASSTGTISFSGTGGILDVESTTMPTATIASFVSGDTIRLDGITYSAKDKVTVATAGTVTIVTPNMSYKLDIAGATVGETDFRFGTGSLLTKAASPKTVMAFLPAGTKTPGPAADHASLFATPTIRDMLPARAQGFTLSAHDQPAFALGQSDLSPSEKLSFIEMALLRHASTLF